MGLYGKKILKPYGTPMNFVFITIVIRLNGTLN